MRASRFVFLLFSVLIEIHRPVSNLAFESENHRIIKPYMIVGGNRNKRDVNTLSQNGHHLEELTLGFKAFSTEFLVDLRMNKDLFPNHFVERHYKEGEAVIHKPYEKNANHCYYNGHVRGVSNSWAAISTCRGISGTVFNGSEVLSLEPTKENNTVFIFRQSDLSNQNLSCEYNISPLSHLPNQHFRFLRDVDIRGPHSSNKQSRYVELVLVNDVEQYKAMKEDREAVVARSKEIANIMNALYSPLNVFIALVGVEIWTDVDKIPFSGDGDRTLTGFLRYRREHLVYEIPNDNAQLITGRRFDGAVVSKALKGPICTYEYSGGVNMDTSSAVAVVATTIAHSLGHNFGMEHDTSECQCPDDRCIMTPFTNTSAIPTHWSSCSEEFLQLAFKHGLDYCLRNRPAYLMGPICGNGFVEDGEQCDCGVDEFCNNPCCNAASCTLSPNATCATGECCDLTRCQIKSAGTICRTADAECDLPEFCDGEKEYCPDDIFKQNGLSCDKDKAYCYKGMCRSHSDQCKLLWGETGEMSNPKCFELNNKGVSSGNCGYHRRNQTYKSCEEQDVLCGRLHCTHFSERLEFGFESVSILSRSFIIVGGNISTCRSAIIDLGLSDTDPGLVPDGAKCGENKVCLNQRCVPVDIFRGKACPRDCNKRGICNSKGNCHCDIGYAPPFCDASDKGGSPESEPVSSPNDLPDEINFHNVFSTIFDFLSDF